MKKREEKLETEIETSSIKSSKVMAFLDSEQSANLYRIKRPVVPRTMAGSCGAGQSLGLQAAPRRTSVHDHER